MPSNFSRRSLLAVGVGGLGTLATGGLVWNGYARRHHIRLQPLDVRNESDEPATVTLTVTGDRITEQERVVELAPAGEGRENTDWNDHLRAEGHWRKRADEYAIEARYRDERVEIDSVTIHDRINGSRLGSDCVHLTIVVTEERKLEIQATPVEC